MRRIHLLTLMLMVCTTAFGQTIDEQKQTIVSVKKSSAYLYAEAVCKTQEEANGVAEGMLMDRINEWVATQKKLRTSSNVVVNNSADLQSVIKLPRGNMFRTFRYVKKSDIIPAYNPIVMAVENPMEASVETVMPNVDDDLPEAIAELSQLTKFSQLQECITRLKRDGKISQYGKYESLNPKEDFYLIIYNTSGELEAMLTPTKPERKNVKTGLPDSEKNYPGRGAFGVK